MAISAEHTVGQNLQPFTSNGDIFIWGKNSRVGRKTPNKQTVLEFIQILLFVKIWHFVGWMHSNQATPRTICTLVGNSAESCWTNFSCIPNGWRNCGREASEVCEEPQRAGMPLLCWLIVDSQLLPVSLFCRQCKFCLWLCTNTMFYILSALNWFRICKWRIIMK